MADSYVDYYAVLEVSSTATQDQIRTAYKKAALKSHPDRVASDSPERASRTKKFQRINDAYYTLSDPVRRRDYDAARQWHTGAGAADTHEADEEVPRPKEGGFPWSAFGFGSRSESQEQKFSNEQFGSVFEEMMRESGLADESGEGNQRTTRPNSRFWTVLGSIGGGILGVIIGNAMGGLTGAAAGGKLGSIRDDKGMSVYSVYQQLPQGDKAKLLGALAQKMFATALSG